MISQQWPQVQNAYSVMCFSKVSASIKYFLLHSIVPHILSFEIVLCLQFRFLMPVANFPDYAAQKHTDMPEEIMRHIN